MRLAHVVDGAAVHDRVGPGEVDVLEDAGARRLAREGAQRLDALLRDHHHLAVLDVAHEAGADDVEGAGLGGQDRAAVEFAQHQRADAERVAGADQLLVGERDEGVGALELPERLDEAVDDPAFRERATRWRITSVSEVDWQMAPSRMRSRRSVRPLVRLPLWATAKPPPSSSANSGWTLRRMVSPVVE